MAGREYLKAHCVTCVLAGPLLSMFDQCRSDAFAAVFAVGDEHAELPDSISNEVDVHRPNEHAVDLGQDQRLSAKKALDLGGIGPSALRPGDQRPVGANARLMRSPFMRGFAGSPGWAVARSLSPSSRDTLDDREPHGGNDTRELEASPRVELPELRFGSLAARQQSEHVQIHPLCRVGLV